MDRSDLDTVLRALFGATVLALASSGCTSILGESFDGYEPVESVQAQDGGGGFEAGPEAEPEGGTDAAPEAATDAASEAATEAGPDAPVEPPSCTNSRTDGLETDVDCGGEDCEPCAPGRTCAWDGDCTSSVCDYQVCQAPACDDVQKNGNETDIDCGGGVCSACRGGAVCKVDGDCDSSFCPAGVCTAPLCLNAAPDPGETDVDCGGEVCPPCTNGKHCVTGADCETATCISQVCQAPSCSDSLANGDETDVDCGGDDCAPCIDGKLCQQATDCEVQACTAGICAVPLCANGQKDGDESDVDCGGADCQPCLVGLACRGAGDCASAGCAAGTCTRCAALADPGGTHSYCMDVTEVTQQSYKEFITARGGDTSGQASYCSWNTSFQPATTGGGCTTLTYDPSGSPQRPVTCVDWCDAVAYCTWAGMRLCGGIDGGHTSYQAYGSATASQWQNACSIGGTSAWPYGSTFDPAACNGAEYGQGASIPVAQAASCHAESGSFSGIRDLVGNVWEWEDSCFKYKNAEDNCRRRGGSFSTVTAACGSDAPIPRNQASADLGFRCCS